jgi:hypothetical protein
MTALGHQAKLPSLKIVHLDLAFHDGREHSDDSAKRGGVLNEWQQVENESVATMYNQAAA